MRSALPVRCGMAGGLTPAFYLQPRNHPRKLSETAVSNRRQNCPKTARHSEAVSFPDSAAQNRTQRILARHGASYSSGFDPVIIDLRGLRICCFAVSSMYSLTFCGTTLVYICSTCLSSSAASVVFFCSRYISIADSFSSGICTVIDLFMIFLPCSFPRTHLLLQSRPRLTSLLLPLSQAQHSA